MVNKKKFKRKFKFQKAKSLPLFSEDDRLRSDPAAGNRNGSSLNNAGDWGNYWSSTPNSSNTQNAYNLNFNSGNHNTNWNNRNNGQSVRAVSELTPEVTAADNIHRFSISKERLLKDLYRAYKDARRHKRGKSYQLRFEFRLEENLIALRDELISGSYRPGPATCFIIHDPKMREVFAADFRDRVVHHLFYNYTHILFERTFIHDSYSCIKGRGTHFGIERLAHHIRSVSKNHTCPCYVLKIDIRGYFMHINRVKLLSKCRAVLAKMKNHQSDEKGKTWGEVLDYEFVDFLLESIVNANPLENCRLMGSPDDWVNLPKDKSLFWSASDCGLPIGNLSSQLFSNVYLNDFDQFVKRNLGCRNYGRYVDDGYIVMADRERLKEVIPQIVDYLKTHLNLAVNEDKLQIIDTRYGVEFLGSYVKPYRTYISNLSLKRMKRKVRYLDKSEPKYFESAVNSFLGVLSHFDSYCLRRVIFGYQSGFSDLGKFDRVWLRFRHHGVRH